MYGSDLGTKWDRAVRKWATDQRSANKICGSVDHPWNGDRHHHVSFTTPYTTYSVRRCLFTLYAVDLDPVQTPMHERVDFLRDKHRLYTLTTRIYLWAQCLCCPLCPFRIRHQVGREIRTELRIYTPAKPPKLCPPEYFAFIFFVDTNC